MVVAGFGPIVGLRWVVHPCELTPTLLIRMAKQCVTKGAD